MRVQRETRCVPDGEKPASISTCLAVGFVTTAVPRPDATSETARSIASIVPTAEVGSGLPAFAHDLRTRGNIGRCMLEGRTGLFAFDFAARHIQAQDAARSRSSAGSARTAKGGSCSDERSCQTASVMSGPIPAGSPCVRMRGACSWCLRSAVPSSSEPPLSCCWDRRCAQRAQFEPEEERLISIPLSGREGNRHAAS